MKKYSIVGLSLLAVSAITAAFVPSKASTSGDEINGILSNSSGINNNVSDETCREALPGEDQFNCSYTVTVNNGLGSSTDAALNSHSNTAQQSAPTVSGTTQNEA